MIIFGDLILNGIDYIGLMFFARTIAVSLLITLMIHLVIEYGIGAILLEITFQQGVYARAALLADIQAIASIGQFHLVPGTGYG